MPLVTGDKRYDLSTPVSPQEKPLHWIDSSQKDLIALPAGVVGIRTAQAGSMMVWSAA